MYKTSKKELVEKYEYDTIKLRNSYWSCYHHLGGKKGTKLTFETFVKLTSKTFNALKLTTNNY